MTSVPTSCCALPPCAPERRWISSLPRWDHRSSRSRPGSTTPGPTISSTRLRSLGPEPDSVLLIGHNPGFHDLVALLAPPGPAAFPTGALAELLVAADELE